MTLEEIKMTPDKPGHYWAKILQTSDEYDWELVRISRHPNVSSTLLVDYFGGGCSTLDLVKDFAEEWRPVLAPAGDGI